MKLGPFNPWLAPCIRYHILHVSPFIATLPPALSAPGGGGRGPTDLEADGGLLERRHVVVLDRRVGTAPNPVALWLDPYTRYC